MERKSFWKGLRRGTSVQSFRDNATFFITSYDTGRSCFRNGDRVSVHYRLQVVIATKQHREANSIMQDLCAYEIAVTLLVRNETYGESVVVGLGNYF